MSEDNRVSSLLSASLRRESAPLIIFAYAVVATVIAGFAAPAAGLAILALGLLTALSLAFTEWRRDEGDSLAAEAPASGARYVFGASERSSSAYLRNARRWTSAASAEAEPHAAEIIADGPPEASREGTPSPMERGVRSGALRPVPSNQMVETPSAA